MTRRSEEGQEAGFRLPPVKDPENRRGLDTLSQRGSEHKDLTSPIAKVSAFKISNLVGVFMVGARGRSDSAPVNAESVDDQVSESHSFSHSSSNEGQGSAPKCPRGGCRPRTSGQWGLNDSDEIEMQRLEHEKSHQPNLEQQQTVARVIKLATTTNATSRCQDPGEYQFEQFLENNNNEDNDENAK